MKCLRCQDAEAVFAGISLTWRDRPSELRCFELFCPECLRLKVLGEIPNLPHSEREALKAEVEQLDGFRLLSESQGEEIAELRGALVIRKHKVEDMDAEIAALKAKVERLREVVAVLAGLDQYNEDPPELRSDEALDAFLAANPLTPEETMACKRILGNLKKRLREKAALDAGKAEGKEE